jgi:hypothetical protein
VDLVVLYIQDIRRVGFFDWSCSNTISLHPMSAFHDAFCILILAIALLSIVGVERATASLVQVGEMFVACPAGPPQTRARPTSMPNHGKGLMSYHHDFQFPFTESPTAHSSSRMQRDLGSPSPSTFAGGVSANSACPFASKGT